MSRCNIAGVTDMDSVFYLDITYCECWR